MRQEERRMYLIKELQKEMPEYAGYPVPADEQGQRDFLRGLFNVRPARPASEEFTGVQDAYLKERAREKGITDAAGLSPVPSDERLILWQGDITTLRCDAIVNAANETMTGCWRWCHTCVDNVYFSMTQSAITIPPWSRKLNQLILRQGRVIRDGFSSGLDEEHRKDAVSFLFAKDIKSGRYSVNDILKEIYRTYPDLSPDDNPGEESITYQRLFEDEYKALCTETDEDSEDVFKNEKADVPEHFREYFSDVYLVRRLREVMVLKGFRRITPEMPSDKGDPRSKGATREFMPVSHQELDWLPANRLYGEGIFIRFNEDRLKKWEKSVGDRYDEMKSRLRKGPGADKFSPRYVLLHTFSHLLIRQLTAKCGYSGSAIRERIYSTYRDHEFRMAGVLIYTSSSDSDGSLGGLVRQGEPEELDDTILNLLQEATWCSSDPLCIESKSQGYNSLNYAACHACTLLPETSCEARNCLLDRVAVVGKDSDRTLGYFGDILED